MAEILSNDQIAMIGKRGCGKTWAATWLHKKMVSSVKPREGLKDTLGVIISTKGDPADLALWAKNGYEILTPETLHKHRTRLIVVDITKSKNRSVKQRAQDVVGWCYARTHCIILVDEYTQICQSTQEPGEHLYDAMSRGRGRFVGIIGLTQQPVRIPRDLISQADQVFLFDCPHPRDLKYLKGDFCAGYRQPKGRYGFFYRNNRDRGDWKEYNSIQTFARRVE